MAYRIGIFDPALNPQGHFVAFNTYVAKLLAKDGHELIFFDLNNILEDSFSRQEKSTSIQFVQVDDTPSAPLKGNFSRIRNLFRRIRRWRRIAERIADEKLDMVFITSESYDPFFYLFLPKYRFVLFILNARAYVFRPREYMSLLRGLHRSFFRMRYRLFVRNAQALFTTNEPSMIPELEAELSVHPIPWVPNLAIEEMPPATRAKNKESFSLLTIGTISKSKNHLFALHAFEKLSLPYDYMIAGLPRDATGAEVVETVERLSSEARLHVRGMFGYIDDTSYANLLSSADFSLLPYDYARGNISSQVMHESFAAQIPIIAPDIEPFRWYVERYGIGFLYKEGDEASFAETLQNARTTDPHMFTEGFKRLADDLSLGRIRDRFQGDLKGILPD